MPPKIKKVSENELNKYGIPNSVPLYIMNMIPSTGISMKDYQKLLSKHGLLKRRKSTTKRIICTR